MRILVVLLSLCPAFAQPGARPSVTPEAGANLPAQTLGPNDLIAVSVYDAPELSRTIRVSADGWIRLPMLSQRVKAQGRYPDELENAISRALQAEELLISPFVSVTIAEYHSRPISVAGAVRLPVVFQAEGPVTLLDAIARAQGLREDAGREILISGPQPSPDAPAAFTRRIPVRSLMDDADPAANIRLHGGEEVRIPEVGRIYIMGNVKKPGAFPVQDGTDTTVRQMLALAEGLLPYAGKQAFIYRREPTGGKSEIAVPLERIMKRQAPDVALAANDIFYIPDNSGRRLAVTALERILAFGGIAGSALIYTTR